MLLSHWNQIKADILGMEIVTTGCSDSSRLGAAMLAAVGARWFAVPAAAAVGMSRLAGRYHPRRELESYYDERSAKATPSVSMCRTTGICRWTKTT